MKGSGLLLDELRDGAMGILGREGLAARRQPLPQGIATDSSLVMDSVVVREEVPRQPVHEDRTHQALLNQEPVIAKSREQFFQAVRHTALQLDPLHLLPERSRSDRRAPELLERSGFLQ